MDEVRLASIRDRYKELEKFERRRAAVLVSLTERNLLTEELDALDRSFVLQRMGQLSVGSVHRITRNTPGD